MQAFQPRLRSHPGPALTRLMSIAFCACALAVLGCDDPQAPDTSEPDSFRGVYDPAQGALEFRLESASGVVSDLRLVATQLTFDSETREVHAWIAVRNTGGAPLPGPAAIVVSDFRPSDVTPVNGDCMTDACLPPNSPDCTAPCVFDHQGTYGSDGMLEPGEISEPVEWILHNPSGESFAFRARFGRDDPPDGSSISGVVFLDRNASGGRDNDEPGIPGSAVALVFGDEVRTTTTDDRGRFRFPVKEAGLYTVVWRARPDECAPTTPTSLEVVILTLPDGSLSSFARADFGCRGADPGFGIPVVGSVYVDSNQNGQRDHGEAGVPGVLVTGAALLCPTIVPIEARTDERGNYTMRLPDCEPPFAIHRASLPGFIDTSPNPITFERRPPPGSPLRADFGVLPDSPFAQFNIEGVVFLDANRNGMRDSDESGVPGVEMAASGLLCLTPIAAFTRTDELGRYVLRGADVHCLLPWVLQRHGPWDNTTPNPVVLSEPPPDGSNTFHVDFGVVPPDSLPPPEPAFGIEGFVFFDLDGDGLRSSGEPGVPDAEVVLLSTCRILRVARTDMSGRYHFPPDVVAHCPVNGVLQSAPDFPERTTPNPVLLDPNQSPGPLLLINFGIVPGTVRP